MYQTAPYFVHDIQPTAKQLRNVLTNYGLMKRNNKSILHPYSFWLCEFMTSTRTQYIVSIKETALGRVELTESCDPCV